MVGNHLHDFKSLLIGKSLEMTSSIHFNIRNASFTTHFPSIYKKKTGFFHGVFSGDSRTQQLGSMEQSFPTCDISQWGQSLAICLRFLKSHNWQGGPVMTDVTPRELTVTRKWWFQLPRDFHKAKEMENVGTFHKTNSKSHLKRYIYI